MTSKGRGGFATVIQSVVSHTVRLFFYFGRLMNGLFLISLGESSGNSPRTPLGKEFKDNSIKHKARPKGARFVFVSVFF